MDDQTSEKVLLEESSQLSQIMTDSAEFEENIEMQLITFNKMKLKYGSNEILWAYFCASDKCYQMKDTDRIGICQLPGEELIISKQIIDCEVDPDIESFAEFDLKNEKISAKKASFNAYRLPSIETVAVFYQFCYQSGGKILGRSTPFQITKKIESSNNDDEDEFVVVRSQESFLSERIEHLTKSNSLLQYLISSMEKDLSEKNSIIESMKFELNDSKKAFQDLVRENEETSKLLESNTEKQSKMEKEFLGLKLRHEVLKKDFETVEKEKGLIETQLKIVQKNKKDNSLDAKISEYQDKLTLLKVQLETMQSKLAESLSERRSLTNEKLNLEEKVQNLLDENNRKDKYIEELETLKTMHSKEIKSLEEELKNVITNFQNLNDKYELESKLNQKRQQDLTLEIDKLFAEYTSAQLEKQNLLKGSDSKIHYPSLSEVEADVETSIEAKTEVNTAVKVLEKESNNDVAPKTEDIPCTMCNVTIKCRKNTSTSEPMLEMIEHFETVHNQKMCPVCSVLFDTRLPFFSKYFSNHVLKHFNSMKYPK